MGVSTYKTQIEESYHSLLLDYASGTLDEAHSLIMATHVALSPYARRLLGEYEMIGGALLNDCCIPQALSAQAKDSVFAKLDMLPCEQKHAKPDANHSGGLFPKCLSNYMPSSKADLPWKKTYTGLYSLPIQTTCTTSKAEILKIDPGTFIPEHSHKGYEITLVLDGAFHDESGTYSRGDIIITDETITHKPISDDRMGCICLVVTTAPPRLTGLMGRLLNPFLRF
jgi:putative transcriptional regulator